MMKRLLKEYEEQGLEEDDLAFCLVDGDVNPAKDSQIVAADRLANGTYAKQIVSNPCFEVWFLDHYHFTTRQFRSSADVVAELSTLCPGYAKGRQDMYELTKDALQAAIKTPKSRNNTAWTPETSRTHPHSSPAQRSIGSWKQSRRSNPPNNLHLHKKDSGIGYPPVPESFSFSLGLFALF